MASRLALDGPDVAPKPPNLVTSQLPGQAEGDAFSLNDAPVYEAPSLYGHAYLLPAELLARVRYHRFDDGLPVALHFEPDAEALWTGTMVATIERAVKLADLPAFRIRFPNEVRVPGAQGEAGPGA